MRILAIGDFHGRFPAKLKKKVEKLAYDVIISPGDFCGDHHIKLFFKHSYGTDKALWEFIGKKKYIDITRQNVKEGNQILSYLKSLNKPLFVVTGNHDHAGWREVGAMDKTNANFSFENKLATREFIRKLKISDLDFAKAKFDGIELVGYPRSSYPGIVRNIEKKKGYRETWSPEQTRKDYADHKGRMSKLFINPSNTIFLSHNVPYRTTLDKIQPKGTEKKKLVHYGSALVKDLIRTYQPRLVIAGHMHENPGKQRIGKTVVVNPGAAMDGRCALIELTEKNIRVRLIKV